MSVEVESVILPPATNGPVDSDSLSGSIEIQQPAKFN